MVKKTINKKIIEKVNKFRETIEAAGVPVEKMVVFGSQAKGGATEDSDIDVCVVSKSFGKDDIDEMQWLFKKTRFVDTRIEPYPLSLEEFKNGYSPIIDEIRKYGIVV